MSSDHPTSRKLQAEARREQILDAALEAFCAKGFAGASVRDIARACGVTEGLLYHYFPSKEQLHIAVWKERMWGAQMDRILQNGAGKPVESVLTELILDFLLSLHSSGSSVRMTCAEMQHNADLNTLQQQKVEQDLESVNQFLRERQKMGEIRAEVDVTAIPRLLMGAGFAMFLLWGREDASAWRRRAEEWTASAMSLLVSGLKAH
jgi:AcrR family transcriptional regulator